MSEQHPTQRELIEGAMRSIEEILLPELQTPWARATAIQLQGLLRYTLDRQERDIRGRQDAELGAVLEGLAIDFPALLPAGAGSSGDEYRANTGELLAYAQRRDDAAAGAVRARLRPLVLRHCAEDLGESGPLFQGFMAGFRRAPDA